MASVGRIRCVSIASGNGINVLPRHHLTRRWRFQQFQHSTGNFTLTHHYLIRTTFGDIRHFIVIMGAGNNLNIRIFARADATISPAS